MKGYTELAQTTEFSPIICFTRAYRFVDSQLVGHLRFEHEGELLINQLSNIAAARASGAIDRTPVVFYGGPLIASFVNSFEPDTRERYIETLSRVIAASQHHKIPLVGYVAGSSATELVKMIRLLMPDEFGADRVICRPLWRVRV